RATRLQAALRTARGNRKELVEQIQTSIEKRLIREKILAEVIGREKHLFSIYEKMRQKKKYFTEIMDVYAFRIIVDSVDTCYRMLGALHNHSKTDACESKGNIARPPASRFLSLHAVLGRMRELSIQGHIRSREMDEMPRAATAAHFLRVSQSSQSVHRGKSRD